MVNTYNSVKKMMYNEMHNNDLNTVEIAERLRVSRGTVSNWLNGHRDPTLGHLRALCKLFNCTFVI